MGSPSLLLAFGSAPSARRAAGAFGPPAHRAPASRSYPGTGRGFSVTAPRGRAGGMSGDTSASPSKTVSTVGSDLSAARRGVGADGPPNRPAARIMTAFARPGALMVGRPPGPSNRPDSNPGFG